MKNILTIILLSIIFTSCRKSVKVIEVKTEMRIDTSYIYTYKVLDKETGSVSTERKHDEKYKVGDQIQVVK